MIEGFLLVLAHAIAKEEGRGFEEDAPASFFQLLVMGFCVFVCMALIVGMVFLP